MEGRKSFYTWQRGRMAHLNIPLEFILPDSSHFDFEEFNAYRERFLPRDISVWTPWHMDHQRLPGNIDIFEFMMYVGMRFEHWLEEIGYQGEMPLYAPAFPDYLMSKDTSTYSNEASPHHKVPWSIFYRSLRREPMSRKPPFGKEKNYGFKVCGYFQDTESNIYGVRMKWWENLVKFTIAARSGAQAEIFTRFFEQYMELNTRYFQEAGINKIFCFGSNAEEDTTLDNVGLHYRHLVYWIDTQCFQVHGPVTTITKVGTVVNVFS
jgi:hypothetical protein